VVDDGSTDARTQAELARAETAGARVIRQSNQGLARARNVGIAATRAAIIIPLDADNRLRPAMVEEAVRVLKESNRVGVVYGDAEYIGERSGRWTVGPFDLRRLLEWNYIDACAAIRRKVWEENGGYDAGMPLMGLEDWDFWLSTHERGWSFEYVPKIFFDYRVRSGSMSAATRVSESRRRLAAYVAGRHGELYRNEFLNLRRKRKSLRQLSRLGVAALRRRLGWR
jgi:glycosyltransferase involved in cell wall biosynthesis